MDNEETFSVYFSEANGRIGRLERLVIRLMPDEMIAQELLDGDAFFLQLVLEEKCKTGAFHIRRERDIPGGLIIMRAVERLPVGRESAKLLDIPEAVSEYVGKLAQLGAKLRIDNAN